MKFRRVSDYAEESECRRYTVSAAKVRGRWTFQGWLRGALDGAPTLLTSARITKAEEAREACRRHAGININTVPRETNSHFEVTT